MYVHPEVVIPNFFELDQLPYLKQDQLPMQSNLTSKRMLEIRNFSHRHEKIMCKIFAYWPTVGKQESNEQRMASIIIFQQIPVISLQSFTFLLNDLQKTSQIPHSEWNQLIALIEMYKKTISKYIDKLISSELALKMENARNINSSIYFSCSDQRFKIKAAFKSFAFGVSFSQDIRQQQQEFIIQNQVVVKKLQQRLCEKLEAFMKRGYDVEDVTKIREKMQNFYNRQLKHIDEQLLELKLKYNYPMLRTKYFMPIKFTDSLTNQRLLQPIISNKNKNCTFAHLNGYNSSTYQQLQNTYCKFCGTLFKEVQENRLLMFLRSNLFNINAENNEILYCPEFNRWKIIKRCQPEMGEIEVQSVRKQINELKITEQMEGEGKQENGMDAQDNGTQMNNEQQVKQIRSSQHKPSTQIYYRNYMHLCITIKSLYPLTKKRIYTPPKNEQQIIPYIFNISNYNPPHNHNNHQQTTQFYKYFQPFQLTDPVRGKMCTHLQFCDLRLFYSFSKKVSYFNYVETVYCCPICGIDVKDQELMYLKEVLVLIKFIRKLLEPEIEDDFVQKKEIKSKVDRNSINIIINNVEKRVFIQYQIKTTTHIRKQWKQIQKFYPTLIDPYVPFSDYSLGLNKKKHLDALYNFGQEKQTDNDSFEKDWYGQQDYSFAI